jgi:DNA-binding SARP family transcriptional activator
MLLVHANQVVSSDRLIEELWPGQPRAADSLQVRLSELRKVLRSAGEADRLATRPPGYLLRVTPTELDTLQFEPGLMSHLELQWEDHQVAGFFRRLAKLGRLIMFDKRDTGLSDRAPGDMSLEERMEDVRAVMRAAGSSNPRAYAGDPASR